MDPARRANALAGAALAALLAGMAACVSHGSRVAKPAVPAPPPPEPTDASYDWHALLPIPFGGGLTEVPLTLHEVLLFKDEARRGAPADDAECYASDSPPPRFLSVTPDEYLLCFRQDRLSRVQASVLLPAARAAEAFAKACALWLRSAAAVAPQAAGTAGLCEGRDGAVHFVAHLGGDAVAGDAAAGDETPGGAPPPAAPNGAAPEVAVRGAEASERDTAAQTSVSILLDGAPDRP